MNFFPFQLAQAALDKPDERLARFGCRVAVVSFLPKHAHDGLLQLPPNSRLERKLFHERPFGWRKRSALVSSLTHFPRIEFHWRNYTELAKAEHNFLSELHPRFRVSFSMPPMTCAGVRRALRQHEKVAG